MCALKNICLFGCVIVSSLVLLNNCIAVLAKPISDVKCIDFTEAAGVTLANAPPPHSPNTTKSDYHLEVLLNKKIRHAESGEYEMRNGRPFFVVRGLFQYYTEDDVLIKRPYIFDIHGYHEIPNEIDIRGEEFGSECDLSAGQYCIDPKLLKLLVG